jgi:hypothetical protein
MISKIPQVHWRSRVRAQTCAQHYIYSVGAQMARLIETQIGKTLIRAIETSYGSRRAHNYGVAAIPRKREAGEPARSAIVHEWNMAAQPPLARVARSAHIVERASKKGKKVAESQRVHEWNKPRA